MLLVVVAGLLACARVRAQEPAPPPGADGPARVIHADMETADQVAEPAPSVERAWVRADAWVAWIKNGNFPVLLTAGAATDPLPGALGQQGTQALFGGGNVDAHERLGARIGLGAWCDDEQCFGLELGYAFLASRAVGLGLTSPGSPVLARPFFNLATGQQDASLVTYPGVAVGGVEVHSGTWLQGADINGILTLNSAKEYPVRLLAGFRYLHLHDDLTIQEDTQVESSSPIDPGQHLGVRDQFGCDNYFYGTNLGLSAAYRVRRLEVQFTAQCALGVTQECVNVAGWTRFDGPGGSALLPGGLLAVASNSGSRTHDVFGVVPEADLDVRYEVTPHLVLSVGYSFLYWNRAARSGQQVDTRVNPDLVPTSQTFGQPTTVSQPAPWLRDADFWVQGVHFGVELRF
jgi:hypothetical protein